MLLSSIVGGTGVATEGILSDVLVKGTGSAAFILYNADTWQWYHYPLWLTVILLRLEIVASLVHVLGRRTGAQIIRSRGKHLDNFEPLDNLFVAFNRCSTAVFTYHAIRYLWYASYWNRDRGSGSGGGGRVPWDLPSLGVASGIVAFLALYVVYDLFYTVFHRALHLRGVYRFVHKHHHRQKAPSRGNADAVNVHPFEFLCGEYNHLLAIHLVATYITKVHVVAAAAFVVSGGFLASLNHTRFDVRIPGVYEVSWFLSCAKRSAWRSR